MPFIGNQPALSYTSFAKQDFTTSATTSYTLDNPVANANELALFINFVRQEPTTAYTASGTSLTLTSATSASDDMYCVYLGKAVQTVNPPNASVGISQLSATGTKNATTFLRGDNTFAVAGGTNTPLIQAGLTSTQSIPNATDTEIVFNYITKESPSGKYSTSTGRFTPGAGFYFVSVVTRLNMGNNNGELGNLQIRVNGVGSANASTQGSSVRNYQDDGWVRSLTTNCLVELGASDYVSAYIYQSQGASQNLQVNHTNFTAYKILT